MAAGSVRQARRQAHQGSTGVLLESPQQGGHGDFFRNTFEESRVIAT
jgi:hypothetical protein